MPIYEYKCENGHVFDVMRKLAEDPLTSCVECGAPVRKVLHPVGISFKGSGFYSTDYSKKSSKEPASKDTSSKDTSSTSTNGDSKSSGSEKSAEKSAGASKSPEKKD
jgi:putative FmdB family regulatory protein